jgi:hypothetical protein
MRIATLAWLGMVAYAVHALDEYMLDRNLTAGQAMVCALPLLADVPALR